MKIEIDITEYMPAIVECIRSQTEIDLDEASVAKMLAPELRLVAEIAERRCLDFNIKSRLLHVVDNWLLGGVWPEIDRSMDIHAFMDHLKTAARAQGYDCLATAPTAADQDKSTAPVGDGVQRWNIFGPLSAVQKWAFTVQEHDCALRTRLYAVLSAPLARKALASVFPEGTACDEFERRMAKAGGAPVPLIDAVIDEIANEVMDVALRLPSN